MPRPDRADTRPDDPHEADPGAAEIVPSGTSPEGESSPAAGLARWLEQAHRDATANRAQVRELSRTLDRVGEAHEYVGKALRKEQRRSRYLIAVAVLAPLLAGLLVWAVWRRTDSVRREIDGRLGQVVASQDDLRRGQTELAKSEVAEAFAIRLSALEAELDRARNDLAAARASLAEGQAATSDERTAAAAREAALGAKLAGFEQDQDELRALRAQVETLKSRAGSETVRADRLAEEIRALEAQLGAARARLADGPGLAAGSAPAAPTRSGGVPLPPVAPADVAALPPAATAPPAPDGAARRPADTERVRAELNRLLALSAGSVTYTVDSVGGVEGDRLLDVSVTGRDVQGRAIRTLEAKQAAVTIRREADQVELLLEDGHLLLGGHRAPFFQGRYVLVVDAEPEAWRVSALSCLRFE